METVVITGASSGIGEQLAHCFAADGGRLVLTARSEDRLNELAETLRAEHGVEVHVVPGDLATIDGPRSLAARLAERDLSVDVLVNNAGFGALGRFSELSLERQLAMLRLNVMALVELTHRLLPAMLRRNQGGVLNVGSTAAFQPGPNMAVYYASKAFVQSFTEALREELADTNLHVTCLAPGPTSTGFVGEAGMEDVTLFQMGSMSARAVAQAGHRGFRKDQATVVPGIKNKTGVFAVRLTPRAIVRKLVKRLQQVDEDGGDT